MQEHEFLFKWVSVKEDTPFSGRRIIVVTEDGTYLLANYSKEGEDSFFVDEWDEVISSVAAWSYVPENDSMGGADANC